MARNPSPNDATIVDPPSGLLKISNAALEPLSWGDLDGWTGDDHARAFATFYASCRPITRASMLRTESARVEPARARPIQPHFKKGDAGERRARPPSLGSPADSGSIRAALAQVCARAVEVGPLDEETAQRFFEANFVPVRIRKLGDSGGFLTGYYEPIIEGSRVPTAEFTAPLYRRPPNLVVAGRRKFGDAFPSKGVKVGRRFGRRKIVPYYDRGQIEDGALNGWNLEICYLRSPVDVLFAQIQGSARIRLEDGTILRVNYDSHNGWPYTPVGRVLIERAMLTKDGVSMQSIRDWMEANPDLAKDVRRQNKSYVFFRITDLATEDEAIGAEGVPLVPGRSIAVDHSLHVYGMPFFIDANLPIANDKTGTQFHRLMFAQDTGSAIVGPARADIYFGAGDEAARIAGRIKNAGDFMMLIPHTLDPVEAGRETPLPRERPANFSLSLTTTMDDPTDVPDAAPAPAAAAKPAVTPAPPAPKRTARPKP
jgi:membrane-bound lytic murein transglycosylase A